MKILDDVFFIIDKAIEVFGDYQKAKIWLHTTNKAMGGIAPINASNAQEVLDELGRIEHGIVS